MVRIYIVYGINIILKKILYPPYVIQHSISQEDAIVLAMTCPYYVGSNCITLFSMAKVNQFSSSPHDGRQRRQPKSSQTTFFILFGEKL